MFTLQSPLAIIILELCSYLSLKCFHPRSNVVLSSLRGEGPGSETKDPQAPRSWIPGWGEAASTRALVPGREHGPLGHCTLGTAPAGLAVGALTPKGAAPAPPLPACAREASGEFPALPRTGRPGRRWRKAEDGPLDHAPLHPRTQQLFFPGWKD